MVAFSLPYFFSTCIPFALCFPLVLNLQHGCSFSSYFFSTCIPFALCFPLVLNLQHGCLFSSLFLLYLHFFCALLSLTHQLATRLQYPFPISFNLQQYNLFFNLVILKFLSYFSYILSKLHT